MGALRILTDRRRRLKSERSWARIAADHIVPLLSVVVVVVVRAECESDTTYREIAQLT